MSETNQSQSRSRPARAASSCIKTKRAPTGESARLLHVQDSNHFGLSHKRPPRLGRGHCPRRQGHEASVAVDPASVLSFWSWLRGLCHSHPDASEVEDEWLEGLDRYRDHGLPLTRFGSSSGLGWGLVGLPAGVGEGVVTHSPASVGCRIPANPLGRHRPTIRA